MKNKLFLTLLLLTFSCLGFSQSSGTTRAVIIGISDYQDPLIPDLQYAHKDAQAFANWLRSPAGGSVPDENILLHTNKAATNAEIIMSIDWLINESKKGDQAFIYLSGHGDVERITKYFNGYFLGYDSPPAVYAAGAFSLRDLRDMVSTMTEEGVKVFLISDACRSGKLAGSSVNGSQVTATRLSEQFNNTIKILSCQPDEFSLEGEQWGGGRGIFSYHLENALYGFADQNEDLQINLMELNRYLQDKVSTEADPESQIPMVQGPLKERIAFVDEAAYVSKKETLKNTTPEFLTIDTKGMEELILQNADSNIQIIYEQFLAAIDSNNLMEPAGFSANDYYEKIIAEPDLKRLHGTVKRKFVVALMNEGQVFINAILKSDLVTFEKLSVQKNFNQKLSNYFHRAAEILGKNHYASRSLKAKELYFKSRMYRADKYPDKPAKWVDDQRKKYILEAIEADSTLAILYFSLASDITISSDKEKIQFLKKAISLAPEWCLAYSYLGEYLRQQNKNKESIGAFKKAISIDSTYLPTYLWLSFNYEKDSARYWKNIYVDKFLDQLEKAPEKIPSDYYWNAGSALSWLNRYDEAEKVLISRVEKTKIKPHGFYRTLSAVYSAQLKFQKAIEEILECPKHTEAHFENDFIVAGDIHFRFLGNLDSADYYFSKIESIIWQVDFIQDRKLYYLFQTEKFKEAKFFADSCLTWTKSSFFKRIAAESAKKLNLPEVAHDHYHSILEEDTSDFFHCLALYQLDKKPELQQFLQTLSKRKEIPYFTLAKFYAFTEQKEQAIENLYLAAENDWEPDHLLMLEGHLCDPFLDPIRETPEYYEFVKTHFPYYLEVATKIPYKNK